MDAGGGLVVVFVGEEGGRVHVQREGDREIVRAKARGVVEGRRI